MSFCTYLNPAAYENRVPEKRHFWLNKDGRLAIVFNWCDSGKWKILIPPGMPFRRAYKYTKEQYASFEDALRVYDMLCVTDGLTKGA